MLPALLLMRDSRVLTMPIPSLTWPGSIPEGPHHLKPSQPQGSHLDFQQGMSGFWSQLGQANGMGVNSPSVNQSCWGWGREMPSGDCLSRL